MFKAPGYNTTEQLYESEGSIIYRAVRVEDGRPVILKVLKDLWPPPEEVARFEHEYQLTRGLALPGVITVHDYTKTENHWVIVEEDFGAESLKRLGIAGELDVASFLELALTITDAVGALHRAGLIHKDINPSNIAMNPDTKVVKLIDFGISVSTVAEESVSFEHPTRLEGTLGYLSPEQTGRTNRPLDYRSDFYSLGCSFYELLTGQLPFATDDLLELVHCHLARTPRAPHELRADLPESLSAIVAKLMAKNPDERYQSAHGLKVDLEACCQTQRGGSAAFDLGKADINTQLRLPAKLYGRAKETASLRRVFAQVRGGSKQFVLVAGYSGVGKSALVMELFASITEHKGLFVSGKFEQYGRTTPYAPIIEALRALIQQTLYEGEQFVSSWREGLRVAAPNCAVLVDAIPQVELLCGPLPQPPPVPPEESRSRFVGALLEFTCSFARQERPLVLFLDDLQWTDAASLDFLHQLTSSDLAAHLLVIGAYRDNEVGRGHPLQLALPDLELAEHLQLGPLEHEDVADLLSDALRTSSARVQALATLIYDKTGGNPFFIGQLLKMLQTEQLIYIQHELGAWGWDIDRIRTSDISDNVVELLVDELQLLPPATRELLKSAACIGNRFDLHTLVLLSERGAAETTTDLLPAISKGYVLPLSNDYRLLESGGFELEQRLELRFKFAHDRIQQAAYALIDETELEATHLSIGRRLREHAPEQLLQIVDHFNRGRHLITEEDERFEVARLNLLASEQARKSAAYEAALELLLAGLELLSSEARLAEQRRDLVCADAAAFERDYELSMELTKKAAEAAHLSVQLEVADLLASSALEHARSWEDRVDVHLVQLNALMSQNRLVEALELALESLKMLGVNLPRRPGQADVDAAIQAVDRALGARRPASLLELPRGDMATREIGAIRILDAISVTTIITEQQLGPIVAAKMVELTLERGFIEASISGYLHHGVQLCGQDRIEDGYEFGRLARQMSIREDSGAMYSEVSANGYYHIFHFREPIRELIPAIKQGYQRGWEAGRISAAVNCLGNANTGAPFITGLELAELQARMRETVEIDERLQQRGWALWVRMHWQCSLSFTEDYDDPCMLRGEVYDETLSLPLHRAENDDLSVQLAYILKIWLCARFGKPRNAVAFYADYVENKYPKSGVLLPPTVMYYCLAQLMVYPDAAPGDRASLLADVDEKLAELKVWAHHCPANYAHKHALIEAERSRALGHDSDARTFYDRAIDLARAHHYLNEESLALERAVSFFRERGQERLAGYYLQDAYHAYQRWGASAKLRELRRLYPELVAALTRHSPTATLSEHGGTLSTGALPDLDLEAVLRASRALNAERDPARLLKQIISTCLSHAGASRGFLLLDSEGELVVKARGVVSDIVDIEIVSTALEHQDGLSHGVVNYVARSAEPVLLADAARDETFKNEPYIRETNCRSLLCIPILYQDTLIGVVYMENERTPGAFKEEHLEVLILLMTQAALSIENARLRNTDGTQEFQFEVGGSLAANTPSYVLRRADRNLRDRIERGDFCYVLNARQMGKSSLRVQTMSHVIRRGVRCVGIDIAAIGSSAISADQWYAGIARATTSGLGLSRSFSLRSWWVERRYLSPVQRLAELFDEIILPHVAEPIVIFIDEIDMMLSLSFSSDDFFGLIRSFYNKRADDERYARLSFVMLGVATPSDLVRDGTKSPFNIGHAISMRGFHYQEARVLVRGLTGIGDADQTLKAILAWTEGQPFLTQRLCQLAQQAESRPETGKERAWIATLVRTRILDKWRERDELQHLQTIEARIVRSPTPLKLLQLYEQVLHGGIVHPTSAGAQLALSGLVVREAGALRISNPIYASVFDVDWLHEVRSTW